MILIHFRVEPKIGVHQNGWFIMENPINMDDLGGFPPIFGNTRILSAHLGSVFSNGRAAGRHLLGTSVVFFHKHLSSDHFTLVV